MKHSLHSVTLLRAIFPVSGILLANIVLSGSAKAAAIVYVVDDTLSDLTGVTPLGEFSGSFKYDIDTGALTDVHISTTAAPGFAATTYGLPLVLGEPAPPPPVGSPLAFTLNNPSKTSLFNVVAIFQNGEAILCTIANNICGLNISLGTSEILAENGVSLVGSQYYRVADGQRAIFTAIPEPLTILGTITAIGLGSMFKRKLAKKKTASD